MARLSPAQWRALQVIAVDGALRQREVGSNYRGYCVVRAKPKQRLHAAVLDALERRGLVEPILCLPPDERSEYLELIYLTSAAKALLGTD